MAEVLPSRMCAIDHTVTGKTSVRFVKFAD